MISVVSLMSMISVSSVFSDFSDFGDFNEFGNSNDFNDFGELNDFKKMKLFERRLRCVLSNELYLVPHTVPLAADLKKNGHSPEYSRAEIHRIPNMKISKIRTNILF